MRERMGCIPPVAHVQTKNQTRPYLEEWTRALNLQNEKKKLSKHKFIQINLSFIHSIIFTVMILMRSIITPGIGILPVSQRSPWHPFSS